MPRRARIHFVSLRSSLVNLPISLYGPLLERSIRPQSLAVHLTLVSSGRKHEAKVEAYVGWTGMASASSLAHFNSANSGEEGMETIEIDPQFAEGLGLALGDVVEIGLLYDLAIAKSVGTEPLTSDDWEIIEIHASHVESTLLSQVRVANIGQEIDVWVLGRTRVRLKVVSLDPENGRALLLGTNTEVSIAPKLRGNVKHGSSRTTSSSQHTKQSGPNGTSTQKPDESQPQQKKPAKILRVLSRRSLPSDTTLPHVSTDLNVAFASYSSFTSLPDLPRASRETTCWRVTVKRLRPPLDPTQESNHSGPASQVTPAPRVLVPNGEASSALNASIASNESTNETILVCSPNVSIPQGHILLQDVLDGVEDWDLVRVTFIRDADVSIVSSEPSVSPAKLSISRSHHGLAGVDDILARCTKFCLTSFAIHATSGRVRGFPGLLVTGRSGAGKTSLVRAVATAMQEDLRTLAFPLYIDLYRYAGQPVAKVRPLLKHWIDQAAWRRPCVMILDNIDKLMPAELEHADSFSARHMTELFVALYGSSAKAAAPNANGIVLLATAESQASLHPLLNSSHIFSEVVHLKPPGKDARRDIMSQLVQSQIDSSDIRQDPASPLNFTALATQTEGYSVTDLKDLVARAIHRAAIRSTSLDENTEEHTVLTPADFVTAQVDFTPHSLRDVKLQKSEVVWADIGGLRYTKSVLRETLEWPTKYGPIFAQSPLRLRSGLLLYGYPGCGKTLLASAVAKECGLNFISIKGPELLNKYIGASEKSVRDLFERASAAKPCVLFFDEFDSIAPKRGHDSTGVTDRVVNQLLTQMDGAEGLDGVYVLAATSRPDLIDSALLRPGRLDKSLLCDMPDATERKEILEALRRKVVIAPGVDFEALSRDTEGFSGADLQALVYNAHLEVVHDTISAHSSGGPKKSGYEDTDAVKYTTLGSSESSTKVLSRAEETAFQRRLQRILSRNSAGENASSQTETARPKEVHEITQEHLYRVLKTSRPSVPPEEVQRLTHIYRAFVADRSGELPVPPDAGGVGNRVSLM